ncbi:MAG TPA: PTS galactitol transporter subunit IIC [Eubacteriaceae bacterium]|jgi:PTS system galactitol-specific IIC component|nr:PTS galactitol transporter subunit IIC [Eubacteriaceae bacterium]
MEFIKGMLDFILGMGPVALMPLIILIFGLIFKVKIQKALKAGLTVGMGFIGINAIIGILVNNLGPASQAMIENWGIELNVIDMGWAVTAAVSWGSVIVPFVFASVLIVNIIMVYTGLTKTFSVDIWNYWSFIFGGALVYYQTGNLVLGVLAGVITAVGILKLADFAYPMTKDHYPGVSFPHGCTISWAPFAVFMNKLIDKIPGLNQLKADPDSIKKRLGFFGEPMVIGIIVGLIIGFSAMYDAQNIILLAMNMGAVMLLMPKMVALLMEGLSVIASGAQEYLRNSERLKGKDILIGIDGAIILGMPGVIASGVLMVPIILLLAVLLPGNRVLPFADLSVLPIWFGWNTIAAKGNVVRGVLISTVMAIFVLFIATDLAQLTTTMASEIGFAFPSGATEITSLATGQHLISWIVVKIFSIF